MAEGRGQSEQFKGLSSSVALAEGKGQSEQFKGWLLKWTNYIKGYQRRWFVLSNGRLSYYRTQEEMAHTCRGTINLAGAFIDSVDSTHFVITNGPSQVYHLRALNEVERQRWVTAVELAKSSAIKNLESESEGESDIDEPKGGGHEDPLESLQDKLKELTTAHDLMVRNNNQLSKLIGDLGETGGGGGRGGGGKLKEQSALFKLTAVGMAKAADEFVVQARNTERRWSRALQHEHSLRLKLQENIEALAKQMMFMEDEIRQKFQGKPLPFSLLATDPSTSSPLNREYKKYDKKQVTVTEEIDSAANKHGVGVSDEEDQFYDALEISEEGWAKTGTGSSTASGTSTPATATPVPVRFEVGHKRNVSSVSVNEALDMMSSQNDESLPVTSVRKNLIPEETSPGFFVNVRPTIENRRTCVPPKPNHKLNLWSIMKNCIGKDLSKIPMPVNFNEPLSMLQRMTEDVLYADILHKAVNTSTTVEEMAYVGAFVTSPYASTGGLRIGKPFNPLLGETYECDRRVDLGWRSFLEQVNHHPPMFAHFVEAKDWTFSQEFTVTSRFRGKYLSCYPIGWCHLVFHKSKSHYTWTKAVTTIHNIIVGKLWIDQSGEIKIINHTWGEEGVIKFHAYSYFSREQQRKVTGMIEDAEGNPRYIIKGYWDQQYDAAKVIDTTGKNPVTEPPVTLWKVTPPEPGNEVMYGFSHFTASLNEPEEGVAPTDCRFRPDQRIMESGDFTKANEQKIRLEEKQRAKRRKREAAAVKAAEAFEAGDIEEAERLKEEGSCQPVWFTKEYDPLTNTMNHVYKGGYWEAKEEGDWSKLNLPDLF